ncbi:MAG: acetyl-CoA C-acyltransferase, partial [Thermoleophilia bacterium]
AGLPVTVPGATINRLCASGLDAAIQGARQVKVGEADLVLAGGVESMTRAPLVMLKPERGFPRGDVTMADTTLGWRLINPKMEHSTESMGETGENVAERYEVSRGDQDAFALESHRRAVAAAEAGRFDEEIVSIEVPQPKGDPVTVHADEGPRPDTTLEKLAKLRPVFREGGTVTAGNSSGVNDGAAALVVASEEKARELDPEPLGAFVGSAVAGVDPRVMGIGPIPAVRKLLERAGVAVGDLDGDGAYEIVLKWDPSNAKDNSQSGYTGNVFVDAYRLNGTRLWRIDLGRNIRAGAHYTQFQVYDYDGDGRAEVAMKTADATRSGTGQVIGNANADFRN